MVSSDVYEAQNSATFLDFTLHQVRKVTKYIEVPEIRYVDKVVDVPKIVTVEKIIEITKDTHERVQEDIQTVFVDAGKEEITGPIERERVQVEKNRNF